MPIQVGEWRQRPTGRRKGHREGSPDGSVAVVRNKGARLSGRVQGASTSMASLLQSVARADGRTVRPDVARGSSVQLDDVQTIRRVYWAELRFPPFARRAFGLVGDGTVDEAWKTHGRCHLGRVQRGSRNRVSSDIVRGGPRRQENRPPLDQWHGVDGAIHALSTATIPSQSSRGEERVDTPPPPATCITIPLA